MSISVMSRVWTYSMTTGSDLLILLAISDFADDDGRAWPSVKTLGIKARVKDRQVHYSLKKLCELGELEIVPNAGPNRCNLYKVLTHFGQGAKTDRVHILQGANNNHEGANKDIQRVQMSTPKPSIKPSIEPSSKARASSESELIAFVQSLGHADSDGRDLWLKWKENGWKNKGQPIKDWKLTIQRWANNGWLESQKKGSRKEAARSITQTHNPKMVGLGKFPDRDGKTTE